MDLPELYTQLGQNILCFKFQHLGIFGARDFSYGAIHLDPRKTPFIVETEACSLEELAAHITEERKRIGERIITSSSFPLLKQPYLIYPLTRPELANVQCYVKGWYQEWRINFTTEVMGYSRILF